MLLPNYHRSLEHLHVNTVSPRAYFIPCANREEAELSRENSSFFRLLNGEWDFAWFASDRDVPAEVDFNEKITVPCCWQNYLDRGYDVPAYTNLMYHFPCDAPHLPDDIPCGVYRRFFELSDADLDGRQNIVFEGVSSGFYLYINGRFVGYSQVSHSISEFDISSYLHTGTNEVCVAVVKWCTGTYLEDQDMFRLSGIFRDVYLLLQPKRFINDIDIRTYPSDDFSSAEITVKLLLSQNFGAKYELYSPSGELVFSKTGDDFISETVSDPVLWSSESPSLYSLYIYAGDEVVLQRIGIRKYEISDRRVLINGKEVKALGVNRHDNNPKTGYYCSVDDMLKDIFILKSINVNFIRTSHYPNDPRFAELCDKYGLMLCDEADIETHGMGYDYNDTWDWPRWSSLSDSPDWTDSYVDRGARLYERDKNRACVVLWSLGNESGVGDNHKAMADYIHARDSRAIIHYENSHLEFKPNRPDISDVESRMYPSLDYTKKYLENPEYTKPFFICEFLNSATTGGTHEHVNMIRQYPNFFGGCFWEFADHAIDDNGKLKYGGDFGEEPNDTIGCIDGVVFPDRTPHPGLYDLKKAYQEYEAEYSGGTVTVKSRRWFTSLSDMKLLWSIEKNGVEIESGDAGILNIAPGESTVIKLFNDRVFDGVSILRLTFVTVVDQPWANAGHETGFCEFTLSDNMPAPKPADCDGLSVTEEERYLRIAAANSNFVFDKAKGELISAICFGKELLGETAKIQFTRAPTWNHFGVIKDQKECGIYKAVQKCYNASILNSDSKKCTVRAEVAFGRAPYPPFAKGNVDYTFYASGEFSISADINVRANTVKLARAGIELHLPETFETYSYFGYGPIETYSDKYLAAKFSRFELPVKDSFVPYIRPQENSSHFGSRWAAVSDGNVTLKASSAKPFSSCTSVYTPEQLIETLHDYELVPSGFTVLNIDPYMGAVEGHNFVGDKKLTFSVLFSASAEK